MNTFMNALNNADNYKLTENGGLAHKSTMDKVLDMFATGAAYRNRSDDDCIVLFKEAFDQDALLAMKCLFYLRDVRGGQGERRFFRVVYHWLCQQDEDKYYNAARLNLFLIPTYGRYDDLVYITLGTRLWSMTVTLVRNQLQADLHTKTPTLCAKWLPSENASSQKTKEAAHELRVSLGWTAKRYRQTLSELRKRINIVERLMSENNWNEIDFSKLPSRAGMIYSDAFQNREETKERYAEFINSKDTKVHASTLYPYEIVAKATSLGYYRSIDDTNRKAIDKYWENLPDYFEGKSSSMICVVDTSGSMTGYDAAAPINVAISLGLYCAERLNGPFHDKYISFASHPQLITTQGSDFVDKVRRIYRTNLCDNTNLEAVFDLLLQVADMPIVRESDIPKTICVISDMEIDAATTSWRSYNHSGWTEKNAATMMERMREKWERHGHKMPKLVYWNVDARQNTILDNGPDVSFVSGMSPSIFQSILTGKTGVDLMLEALNSERYEPVRV